MRVTNEIIYWVSLITELENLNGLMINKETDSKIKNIIEKTNEKLSMEKAKDKIILSLKIEPDYGVVIHTKEFVNVNSEKLWNYVENKYQQYEDFQKGIV